MRKLRIQHEQIIDESGRTVTLRGVNLGGWLMMEGYILGGRNIPEQEFRRAFRRQHSRTGELDFTREFRRSFICRADLRRIKDMGFTCVRIPFHYRICSGNAAEGISFLDQAVSWCEEIGLYAILDLHAAPGAQNADWHSDSTGKACLWEDIRNRDRTVHLWEKIARRYAKVSAVAGYDILNEPVIQKTAMLNAFYNRVIAAIRSADDDHIIFVEGNMWAQDLDMLRIREIKNIAYSIHFYLPLDHTFNFIPGDTYPGRIGREQWDMKKLSACLSRYRRFQQRMNAPIFVGEFGINLRCYHCRHEVRLVHDILKLFRTYGWHWTYWTYKAVAGGIFPNGIYQLLENPSWVNRQGPVTGWETYPAKSRTAIRNITRGLRTERFTRHREMAKLLSGHV